MRPVRLQLKGFTSFKDRADVSFEALDRFAICGPTGAGKSSLLDAMTFALFADAPRKGTGNLANMISLGRKSFSVVLDFAVGERTFRVTRVRRRTGAGSDQLERLLGPNQSEQVASGERPVTEKIEQMLGLNYGHFTQAVFLPQGKFSEFLKAKPADRRRLLNELLRLLVYERMQERAGKDRELHADKKAQAERRLKEDFNGVTAEALAELERQRNEHSQAVVAADAELPALRANWESVRQTRAWTVEWEGKIAERVNHFSRRPGIDTAQAELNAAQRAAGVVALLDQAENARRDDHRRQDALRHALRDLGLRREEHTAAALDLTHATEAASALSALRDRLARLNVAEGRLALRDQLARQIVENQGRQRELNGLLETAVATLARLSTEIESFTEREGHMLAEVAYIGFDPDRFKRLDQMRTAAIQLQSERRQLASLQGQVNGVEAAHRRAEADAETFTQEAAGAEANAAAARLRWESATAALRNGESAHAAAHLRATLKPGQDCPVCRRGVEILPADDSVPELDKLRQEETKTKRELSTAERLASKAAADAAAARSTAEAARERAGLARGELLRHQEAVCQHETQVLDSVGYLLPDDLTAPIEERVLDAAGRASEQQRRHREAQDQLIHHQSRLALARQDLDSHGRQMTQLQEQATAIARTIAAEEGSLGAVREEILAAAGTEEPGIESQRVQREITRLEGNLTKVAGMNGRQPSGCVRRRPLRKPVPRRPPPLRPSRSMPRALR